MVGSDAAVLALMDADGCVDEHRTTGSARTPSRSVALVELPGLGSSSTARERRSRLARIDAELGAISRALVSTLVLVIAPAAPEDRSEVTTFGASASGIAGFQPPDQPGLARRARHDAPGT